MKKLGLLFPLLLPLLSFERLGAQSIHEAIRSGDLSAVEEILAEDPSSLSRLNAAGRQPLHEACLWGQLEIMEFLIDRGSDINVRALAGNTTLHWAVHAFVDAGARAEMAQFLLARSPDLARTRNVNGITPLHWAGNELPHIVELLVQHGADVDAPDRSGMTPLHHWTRYWEDDASEVLIGLGADLDATDDHGRTPLHVAAIAGRPKRYRLLSSSGARLSPRDHRDLTPADYASRFGHEELAREMVARGGKWSGPLPVPTSVQLLSDGPGPGGAAVWFLDSNGWAVRTRHELLIFDYSEWGPLPPAPGLANGRLRGRELADLSVTVFASRPSSWDQSLLALREQVRDLRFVLGFQPESFEGIAIMDEGKMLRLGGLEVISVTSDEGASVILVRADGVTVVHGSLPGRFQGLGGERWANSLRDLKEQWGPIDLAFLPVVSNESDQEVSDGDFLQVLDWLEPGAVFTSGGSGPHRHLLRRAAEHAITQRDGLAALAPEDRGELFLLQKGRVTLW
jgi:ankyrin repeat protein